MDRMYSEIYQNNKAYLNSILDLGGVRDKGINRFEKLSFPNKKNENWKNFKLKLISKDAFGLNLSDTNMKTELASPLNSLENSGSLDFVNGYCRQQNKLIKFGNGVIFGALSEASKLYPHLVGKYLNRLHCKNNNGIQGLNIAFATDGIFIYVPKDINFELPFVLNSYFDNKDNTFVNQKNVIVVEDNSKLKLLQYETSSDSDNQFVNNFSEIFVGENSVLYFDKLQKYKGDTVVINTVNVVQKGNSSYNNSLATLGGKMVRNDVQISIKGKESDANVSGIYILKDNETVDNQVFVDHAVSDCDSSQLFKGILKDNAVGSFKGYVLVRQDSQRTNAYQASNNILVSPTAKAHSKPFLEIYADDVKCSHGSTVGNIDENALFYMKARGIDETTARDMLLKAFVADALNTIEDDKYRELLSEEIKVAI